MPHARRLRYLGSVEHLAIAVETACAEADGGFPRVNVEILGNADPFLHIHVRPRYEWEPEQFRSKPVWCYPLEWWRDSATALGSRRDPLREVVTKLLTVPG